MLGAQAADPMFTQAVNDINVKGSIRIGGQTIVLRDNDTALSMLSGSVDPTDVTKTLAFFSKDGTAYQVPLGRKLVVLGGYTRQASSNLEFDLGYANAEVGSNVSQQNPAGLTSPVYSNATGVFYQGSPQLNPNGDFMASFVVPAGKFPFMQNNPGAGSAGDSIVLIAVEMDV